MILCISEKHGPSWELPLKRFITGINAVRSALLGFHPEHASTINRISMTFLVALRLLQRSGKSCIVALAPRNKKTTLHDKQIFYDPNSLIILWLQTSARESIGNAKDFKPFWTPHSKELSKKLWLPIETDCVDSPSNCSSSSSPVRKPNLSCWTQSMENPQNKNSQTTYSPSFTFTPAAVWEEEGIRARKIRLYPTAIQRRILRQWMGTARWTFNKGLETTRANQENRIDVPSLTKRWVTQTYRDGTSNPDLPSWTLETPKDIRKGGLRDLYKAHKTALANLRAGNIRGFKIGFRSKKALASIEIPKTALSYTSDPEKPKAIRLFPTYGLGEIKLSSRQRRQEILFEADCRLQYKNDVWYLIVPCKIKKKVPTATPLEPVCALDPGERTFQVLYSPNKVIRFQHNRELLDRLHKKLDLFQSLRAKKWIRTQAYKRRQMRIYRRIGFLVDHLHYSTIQELCRFQYILLPTFESQEMVQKRRNGLHSRIRRNLLSLQHFKFKTRLRDVVSRTPGVHLEIVTEHYTSKTCTRCGSLNTPSRDWYSCLSCGLEIDRDINGARNILLKHLTRI